MEIRAKPVCGLIFVGKLVAPAQLPEKGLRIWKNYLTGSAFFGG